MDRYDFSTLAPTDFENLVRDLLSAELRIRFQSFATGKDKGIDLRYVSDERHTVIVQCKHFVASSFSTLRSNLVKELPKVKKLKPQRYMVATSMALTPGNVDEIAGLFSGYCKSPNDVLGRADLNALLRDNPEIEKSHSKLWISSSAILQELLHSQVFTQSALTEQQIRKRLSLLVETRVFAAAREKLSGNKVCILSGNPGVGKTTIAELLLVEHIRNGWQAIVVSEDIREALSVLDQKGTRKQIVYYDDFLGQISGHHKLGKNEDAAIIQLIDSIVESTNQRFILTTREYILRQAQDFSERMHRGNLNLHKFIVECEGYSAREKARILANHLFFNQVPVECIASILKDARYRDLVLHKNYNPRLIEAVTKIGFVMNGSPSSYADRVLAQFKDPSSIWEHAFNRQLRDGGKFCLIVLGSLGGRCLDDHLMQALVSYARNQDPKLATTQAFKDALRELEGSFIQISRWTSDRSLVGVLNPSVLDFLKRLLELEPDYLQNLLQNAVYFSQVEHLITTLDLLSRGDPATLDVYLTRAIRQTIESDETTFARVQGQDKKESWRRNDKCLGDRIETIVHLALDDSFPKVRLLARELLKKAFESNLEILYSAKAAILDELRKNGYDKIIGRSTVERWANKTLSQVTKEVESFESEEDSDEFLFLVQWVQREAANQKRQAFANDSHYLEVLENHIHWLYEGLDQEHGGWALGQIEEFEEASELDLSFYKRWFDIEEQNREPEPDYEPYYGRDEDTIPDRFDDIFDALRESAWRDES